MIKGFSLMLISREARECRKFSAGGNEEALTQDWEEVEDAFVVALADLRSVAGAPDLVSSLTKKQKKILQ